MAELQFDYDITLDQAYDNTCIGNEPNNRLLQYGIDGLRQKNEDTFVDNSNYPSLDWEYLPSLMTSQAVTKIGLKSFPQIGAIGFYTLKYEPRSVILAPLIIEEERYTAPTFELTQFVDTLQFVIADPDDASFTCYRVVIRLDYKAYEYVTYTKTLVVPKPPSGTYQISIMGYIEGRLASAIRDYVDVVISNPNPVDPPGPPGTTNYNDLINKPRIESVELIGNKTLDEIGIGTMTENEIDLLF